MDIKAVTNDDGRRCAALINLLKAGRWDLSGSEAEELVLVKRWVHDMAVVMAGQLKAASAPAAPVAAAAEPPAAAPAIKIKSMGTIGTKSKKRK